MLNLIWDDSFLRILKKWKKRHPDLFKRLQDKLTLFCKEPFHVSLRTHKLSGILLGGWALSISYEYRLVFKFIDDKNVLLIDIGTHDEVY